eukprot:Tamp_27998.p1 GENE.Tamp_27998~~Tamp_27998.p1  ORF type:complete len:128 (-),score=13.46 Tamp_27998:448-798(-)
MAYAAAWMGRLKTLQRLVCDFSASLLLEDDNGFAAVHVAAWAGQYRVVKWILTSGHSYGDLQKAGMPPMTSSCGGKGPHTALEWVRRKQLDGWQKLENVLLKALADNVTRPSEERL